MGQLTRIEVSNFKSYKSTQLIDFGTSYFTSIIGPNGAGKSNMMDAISFVLGIKSSHLRSSQLKDLVYRGRVMNEDNFTATQNNNDPATASVIATYMKDDETELHLKRSITSTGASEYRLNSKVVTAHDYSRALEEENILIKARNFLVFQGDVEAIASQSPKDLTRLIEQISGSLDFKTDYDRLKLSQEQATEASNLAFSKKRSYNTEIKQYQDQKDEVQAFQQKQAEKESAVISHILWKLYHYDLVIDDTNIQIEIAEDKINSQKSELSKAQELFDVKRTNHAKALRQLQKQERSIRKIEKLIEDKSTSMVPVVEKIKVINTNERQRLTRRNEIAADTARQQSTVTQLTTDLDVLDKIIAEFETEQLTASSGSGITLSEQDLSDYSRLKEAFNRNASKEKSQLDNLLRQKLTDEDVVSAFQSKIEEFQTQKTRLAEEVRDITVRRDQASARINEDLQFVTTKKQQLNEMVSKRLQQSAKEQELNEKLQKCLNELIDASADRRESERELRMKETIASLKRIIPGVRGRVSDLCKPKQKKFETAMITVLGRNFDAVVVDTQRTATDCISYMREQRAGICTFIPLDSVVVKPVSTNLRGMHKQMRLALDTIDYDGSNERAMQYACGSTVVCDDMSVAKFVRWDKGVDAKAVTLDGSVIHKGGLMTGGRSNSIQTKKWEDQAVKGLQRLKENLMAELSELAKRKDNLNAEETLSVDVIATDERLNYEREQLTDINRTLQSRQSELRFVEEQIAQLEPKIAAAEQTLTSISQQVLTISQRVREIEAGIFASFCDKIGVSNIQQYEKFQGKLSQAASHKRFAFTTQRTRITNQLRFEQERLAETQKRLSAIEANIEKERQLVQQLVAEQDAIEEQISILNNDLAAQRDSYGEIKVQVQQLADAVAQSKAEVQRFTKMVESSTQAFVVLQEELEKTVSAKVSVLRNCKVEQIDIPLLEGTLADIPIGEEAMDEGMVGDSMEGSQVRAGLARSFGITVNYASLREDLRNDGSDEVEETLLESIRALDSEIKKMTPNMKAVERLEEVEGRLDVTEKEFDKARRDAKRAKDAFNQVKEQRLNLFNQAYSHIADQIDKIYKELTKSKSFPLGGTAYLTVEDQDEPYLDGIKYHAMPPMKRFRDMEQLSGGEKTMAALALLFAIHSFRPSPFFVLDEVDAALDNANVSKIANYIHDHAGPGFQFIVISLKSALFQRSDALIGIYRAQVENSSRALTLDVRVCCV
ncbi:RecF/RecN/SMC [Lipomyces arxii]|uniref:RecF/RecN/SMC n=1 Tax=Lipomyces arxii TaxID=56418 RepID=UPI0034CE4019